MALKLRRQAEMIINENLSHRSARRHRDPLRTGAGSFKRVLGSGHILLKVGDAAEEVLLLGQVRNRSLRSSASVGAPDWQELWHYRDGSRSERTVGSSPTYRG